MNSKKNKKKFKTKKKKMVGSNMNLELFLRNQSVINNEHRNLIIENENKIKKLEEILDSFKEFTNLSIKALDSGCKNV